MCYIKSGNSLRVGNDVFFTSQSDPVSVCVVVNLGGNHLQAAQTDKEAAMKVVKEVLRSTTDADLKAQCGRFTTDCSSKDVT